MGEVRISLTEIDEVRALMEAVAALMTRLDGQGAIARDAPEARDVTRAYDRLHAALARLAGSR